MFKDSDKSSLRYWFAHWCAYQMTALVLGCWKFKYLFHDFEKPWLRLIMPYDKFRYWHKTHRRHHIEYRDFNRIDWEALLIDNECSRFTKESESRTAYQWYLDTMDKFLSDGDMIKYYKLQDMYLPLVQKYELK